MSAIYSLLLQETKSHKQVLHRKDDVKQTGKAKIPVSRMNTNSNTEFSENLHPLIRFSKAVREQQGKPQNKRHVRKKYPLTCGQVLWYTGFVQGVPSLHPTTPGKGAPTLSAA